MAARKRPISLGVSARPVQHSGMRRTASAIWWLIPSESSAVQMAKEKPQQAWKVHPTRKHLPAILSWCAAESYVHEAGKPMKAVELAVSRKGCC